MLPEIPEILLLARTNLQDEDLVVYMDRTTAFVVGVPVLNDGYGLFVWFEKGAKELRGFSTVLSTKIMLRSLWPKTRPREERTWRWQLGPMSSNNIEFESKVPKPFFKTWNNIASRILCEHLEASGLMEMVKDYYVPQKGPMALTTAMANARTKYEEVLAALTQAVITGLWIPEPPKK